MRYPVPAGDEVVFDDRNGVIVARSGTQLFAFLSACPHKNVVKLRWLDRQGRFQCPKHESRYRPDGAFIDGKATRNMDRFAVRLDGATLVVDLDTWFESDRDAARWRSASVTVA